jgi:hypothetical protein
MAKIGLLHDYDLMANAENSASDNTCVICDSHPVAYQWSDYHGEGMCQKCGAPYQLKAGSELQQKEGNYPCLNFADGFDKIAKEYWKETKQFVHYGQSFSRRDGVAQFNLWFEKSHPELLRKPVDSGEKDL